MDVLNGHRKAVEAFANLANAMDENRNLTDDQRNRLLVYVANLSSLTKEAKAIAADLKQ